jgi:hypothetical protein
MQILRNAKHDSVIGAGMPLSSCVPLSSAMNMARVAASRQALTRSRHPAELAVEPTRSQDITMRCGSVRKARRGRRESFERFGFKQSCRCVRRRRLVTQSDDGRKPTPTAKTPKSLRSSAVSWGRTSASILLSRKFLLVLTEAETAKPPADIHGRASHGLAG